MAEPINHARVTLWGRNIGGVIWDASRGIGVFAYEPDFLRSGIQVSPITLPLRAGNFEFPDLSFDTFKGLPGFLADSLPDKFGNMLIDQWLVRQGRHSDSMNPVERLCYTGSRGMGALEFEPSGPFENRQSSSIDILQMVNLASDVISARESLAGNLSGGVEDEDALRDILKIGTSAGGARAKAVLAWNRKTHEFRSGQVEASEGFEHWLLKFDGVSGNRDKELADPLGFGRLEYACYLMARAAGVQMNECRLHNEGGRAHFMTKRFDRSDDGQKMHMLSLCGMRHFDFNQPRAYSYEQAIETMRLLNIDNRQIEEQVRRAFFNIAIRNQDDHVKNIAYIMDKTGAWSLSPAYDVCYAYNPQGDWTSQHQMSLNGKTDHFELSDLFEFAKFANVKKNKAAAILDKVLNAMDHWNDYAEQAGVFEKHINQVFSNFRRDFRR